MQLCAPCKTFLFTFVGLKVAKKGLNGGAHAPPCPESVTEMYCNPPFYCKLGFFVKNRFKIIIFPCKISIFDFLCNSKPNMPVFVVLVRLFPLRSTSTL